MTENTAIQLQAIQEYMDAVADFHEATLLVAEMRARLVNAIEANRLSGMKSPDPLSAVVGAVVGVSDLPATDTTVDKVFRKVVSTNGRTRNSPRSAPGTTKYAVYNALPGDASAIAKRTGLTRTQVWGAVADLVNAGYAERTGSHGNTTYSVKGERLNWTAKEWSSVHYHSINSN